MAKYRQVHTHIWKDGWFLELAPKHKLFFIYLFTNERASISGIYELSKRVMSFESGLTNVEIDEAFDIFQAAEKAYIEGGIVWVVNLRKYHETKSPKVQKAIETDVKSVNDCRLKGIYMERYGIDRVSDTLSIPRSSYSSSSSVSSKNGDEPKIKSGTSYELPPEEAPGADHHEKRQEYITALSTVVKETYAIGYNSADFERVADALITQGMTIEQVEAFGGWWSSNGHYEGKPALKSLLDNIRDSTEPVKAQEAWYENG